MNTTTQQNSNSKATAGHTPELDIHSRRDRIDRDALHIVHDAEMANRNAKRPTAGPWTAEPESTGAINAVFRGQRIKQGHMSIAEVFTDIPEGQANARLIAAAPCLYAAAIEALADLAGLTGAELDAGGAEDTIAKLRSAIARATATTP